MSPLVHFLDEWQTLITGVLALGVGGVSIQMIRLQIKQQDKLHQATRHSRFIVAKAKAPLAAVEIADHAKIYLAAAEELMPLALQRSKEAFHFAGPPFPKEAAAILDALVESANDAVLVHQISALYSEQQVMTARLSDISRPSELALCIDDYVLQPLMMDAIAMNLLSFGRDGQEMRSLSWDDVSSSAKRLLADAGAKAHVMEYIADKKGRGRPVPLALERHRVGG